MDGVVTAEEIRSRFRIPVIFLTAYADIETVQRAKTVEAFGYLVKPVSNHSLLAAIEVALYKHAAERKIEESAAALRRANAELEQFAYAAAHDLQEPLRTVALAADILSERFRGQLDEDADSLLGTMAGGSRRMLAMVKDLLNYSVALHSEPDEAEFADSNKALAIALQNLQQAIPDKDAHISFQVLPPVRMRQLHLLQILQNLIGNSLKYSGERQPRIHISSRRLEGSLVFKVEDNGIGIPVDARDRVFGLFKRLQFDSSGSGIGLALCKRIIEHYGGRIWIEPNSPAGTVFLFTLPPYEALEQQGKNELSKPHFA
jgi:signal transduction histidine kinase